MRNPTPPTCDDLARALSAPEGPADREAVADHLRACPRCAALAAREAALTRLWEATRPAEPSEAAWDALWGRVAARLDAPAPAVAPPPGVTLVMPPRPWLRLAVAAQAAALLAALALGVSHRPPAPVPPAPAPRVAQTAPVRAEVEIDAGEVVLIRREGEGLRTIKLALDDRASALDGNFAMFNYVEALPD